MQFKKHKINWIGLFIATLVIPLLVFFIIHLSPLIETAMQNWSTIQNSNSVTQNDKDKLNASLDTIKAIGSLAGTAATAVGAFVLFLNFTVGNRTAEITESRLMTERFSKAVEQLGSDTLEVCLGGIYSLEKIATDSVFNTYYYEVVLDVLTAFIRETSNAIYESEFKENKKSTKNSTTVQVALNVLGKLNRSRILSKDSLDLRFAKLVGFEFNGSFSRINFTGATLSEVQAYKAEFKKSCFHNVSFYRAYLRECDFQDSDFQWAKLGDSILKYSNFQDAKLIQSNFKNANLSESNCQNANFQEAFLMSANIGKCNFQNAVFTGIEQIQSAKNYEKAIYDDDLCQRLNIPKYSIEDIKSFRLEEL